MGGATSEIISLYRSHTKVRSCSMALSQFTPGTLTLLGIAAIDFRLPFARRAARTQPSGAVDRRGDLPSGGAPRQSASALTEMMRGSSYRARRLRLIAQAEQGQAWCECIVAGRIATRQEHQETAGPAPTAAAASQAATRRRRGQVRTLTPKALQQDHQLLSIAKKSPILFYLSSGIGAATHEGKAQRCVLIPTLR